MIQVQTRIHITKGLRFEIELLAREDATEEERQIAIAVEKWILGLNEAVAAQSGDTLDIDHIGPQWETEQLRAALAEAWGLIDRLVDVGESALDYDETGLREQAEAFLDTHRAARGREDNGQ